jgi:predicted transposase YbfD/YdcC
MVEDDLDFELPRARLGLLLKAFSQIDDDREPHRIVYPIAEVLLLVTCATICSCDDFDDIALWGKHNIAFLRRFSEFHFGVPCARWLRILLNRIDTTLFARCFEAWIAALWPGQHDLIAIDGKTARRSHDRKNGLKALHTLSAYASTAQLVLATFSTLEKDHGRIERRTYIASSEVDWILSDRSYPDQPRFKGIRTIIKVEDRTEYRDKCTFDTRFYIASVPLDIERIAKAIRGHWLVESMHWSLDVTFHEDLSRYRARNGAKNMALVRRFAFNLIKQVSLRTSQNAKATASLKSKRKVAGWSTNFLAEILSLNPR